MGDIRTVDHPSYLGRPVKLGRFDLWALVHAFSLLVSVGTADAADPSGAFAVDGVGSRTYADFIAAKDGDPDLLIAFAGWTTGFITAVNVFRNETFDLTPFQPTELLLAKMQKYCEANPDESYANALGKLVSSLMEGRLQAESDLVRISVGDKAVFIYRSVLADVYAKLANAGLLPQKEPTEYDAAFASATSRYQASKGLPQSGLPDLATMNSLYP